ncbi:MAG: translation initiation factor IF-3 [Candidatus Colwellbacteria bacterium RIFCSPHIGHO2_02_FULL_45_17]|uniref:Translation initiation factor IF-3 n=2 Tax=Candidatus Colwelliibacteriota TaxID=1817904 RepID=A0A1G1ZCN1_9BACT|nr:MAG: translation initiation factor IF-3 [Candidatus Colwellbacteria bacterium RIFCSPHIGHO2_02_FULL_45_17]OGY60788.1 MAG: translation initiation factor IF-3 [Candidatus Colwellbacteria bacterium RIFCSPLOWO2_02_FULL_45_11]OGY62199.1 MAG: translation initiation factor IF-3 [Candidatus Colwellbacteria bacterium RIFCSPLOWO2_12_FULL_46_17]
MILDDGENAGVMKTGEAIKLAEERGLDLILVTPNASPPVARVMGFDKFRYERSKELKKQKSHKAPETKRVQISPRTAKNDLMIQLKKLEKFLSASHIVEIQLVLRGREKANKEWARMKLEEFMAMIEVPHKVTSEIKFGGRGMIVQISPE